MDFTRKRQSWDSNPDLPILNSLCFSIIPHDAINPIIHMEFLLT